MRGAVAIVLVAGVTALVGCGSSNSGASQEQINQARQQGARQQQQKERLSRLEQQVHALQKDQKKQGVTTTSSSSSPGTSGGTNSCGDNLTVGPATTCGFALNVATDYYSQIGSGSGTVQSFSPTTGQTYSMSCTAGEPHVCTGGNNAAVYFP